MGLTHLNEYRLRGAIRLKKIGIVGGGAAGALVAIHLLETFESGDEVLIFEPSLEVGRGVPYGTSEPMHLLNVRCSNMSAFVDRPHHFSEWYARAMEIPVSDAGKQFAPRCEYGRYIGELLMLAAENSAGHLTVIRERAIEIQNLPTLSVKTEGGATIPIDELVLATGHLGPRTPTELEVIEDSPHYLRNPWAPNALSCIESQDSVLILGTGLTMVDLVLSLVSRGHSGLILARSRRGLIPRTHRLGTTLPFDPSSLDRRHLAKSLIDFLRAAGDNWRAAMDGIRPHTQDIWEQLSWEDRRRFVSRLRPFWDAHRHRIPEVTSEILQGLVELGRLDIGIGRLKSVTVESDGFRVETSTELIRTDWILNCTGPDLQVERAKIPILESVIAHGLATYDPLGLGLIVDSDGRTSRAGHVWALGPLCRGSRWETTAVPEIRGQAARIAELLMRAPA